MGSFYENGTYIKKNLHQAFTYYMSAADQNDPKGLYNVARFYRDGISTDKNINLYQKYCLASAKLSYHKAQYRIARHYEKGDLFPQNFEKAFKFYELSAKQNNYYAQCNLGIFYLKGIFVKQKTSNSPKSNTYDSSKLFSINSGQMNFIKLPKSNAENLQNNENFLENSMSSLYNVPLPIHNTTNNAHKFNPYAQYIRPTQSIQPIQALQTTNLNSNSKINKIVYIVTIYYN